MKKLQKISFSHGTYGGSKNFRRIPIKKLLLDFYEEHKEEFLMDLKEDLLENSQKQFPRPIKIEQSLLEVLKIEVLEGTLASQISKRIPTGVL